MKLVLIPVATAALMLAAAPTLAQDVVVKHKTPTVVVKHKEPAKKILVHKDRDKKVIIKKKGDDADHM